MSTLSVKGNVYEIDVVVFDKDGLLFDSAAFWLELARSRVRAALPRLDVMTALEWMDLMDVETEPDGKGGVMLKSVDPTGVLAVASPDEEMVASATFFKRKKNLRWPEAMALAREIFEEGDLRLDLPKAITPKAGFPSIFQRLWKGEITYGIATSDDLDRARRSVQMFDDSSRLSFIVTPRDVARNKPEPDMLELIAKRFNTGPARIMMVGDSPVDVMMAAAAGSVGVGIPEFDRLRAEMIPYASVIADSLDDIHILK